MFAFLTFWCSVGRRAALSIQEVSLVEGIAQTEIDYRQIVVLIEHEILQLDVTMHDFGFVHVVDRRTNLPDILSRFVFIKAAPERIKLKRLNYFQ